MDAAQINKLWIALGISVGAHLLFAVVAEVSSSDGGKPKTEKPVVQISRVAMDGTTLPSGKGSSTFNSPASQQAPARSPNLETFRSLEAGVPQRLNVPPSSPTIRETAPPPMTTPSPNSTGYPTQTEAPRPTQTPTTNPRNEAHTPTPDTGTERPASDASRPSAVGNQGQKRARGPNRAAFPIRTVEPQVSTSLMGGGVTNSVEVTVEIAADGTHTEQLDRSSGSAEVDRLVLEALKQWVWDPAAREGQVIASSQSFKFTFKPR